ncbi:MAG TPA: iron-sulfur cluster assembly scaffold protein [Solimonas sp.]
MWSRFVAPQLGGVLTDAAVIEAEAGSPAARSLLRLRARIEPGRVAAARFQAYGCPVTIAVGQWLAEQLETMTPFVPPTAAQIRHALEISEDKAHCALMGEDVIRALWKQMT